MKNKLKKNLSYAILEKNPNTNVFVLRPSSELMNFNTLKLAIAYRIALLISDCFDNGRGMDADDQADLKALTTTTNNVLTYTIKGI